MQQSVLEQERAEVRHRTAFLLRSLQQTLMHLEADGDRNALGLAPHHPEPVIHTYH